MGACPGDTVYDLTVTGPNRFRRRFTGDLATAGNFVERLVRRSIEAPSSTP